MKINFAALAALTEEERNAKYAEQFAAMSNDDLTASLAEAKAEATPLFALESPTVAQVDEAEAIFAGMGKIEAEQAARAAAAAEAGQRFAKAKAAFSAEPEKDEDKKPEFSADEDEDEDEGDDTGDEGDDTEDADETEDGDEGDTTEGEGDAVVTAAGVNHTTAQRATMSAARKAGRKGRRPAVASTQETVITAAADVPGFSMGAQMSGGMTDVAKALQGRIKNFAPFNRSAAEAAHSASNGQPVLTKAPVASFGVAFEGKAAALTASGGAAAEYDVAKEAIEGHVERINASLNRSGTPAAAAAMTAAMGWCAPSEVVYNWIADYVVDGLLTMAEIPAPRGGLWMTEGPQLAQGTYANPDNFGFGGTEAEMEAGYVKTCETIECPEFVDHRLDFDGYCWKIPILTEKAFPELVADAMRLTDVLYAHRMNRRYIRDVLAESTAITANDIYGGSVNDTLEALVQVAVKERRWWNLGENAVMEVKLPQHAREIFKFDMARRSGLALNDVATDQKIAAYFSNHNLAVEYISDFDSLHGAATPTAAWPDVIRAIMYPVGTFVRAVEDVINLSAVYDAASLSQNEYTGVFFEQGVKVIKRGYRSHVLTIPVCTAGATGANVFTCDNFGSF